MPDRLAELVRQRALVLENLAWLDREIASVTAMQGVPPAGSEPPTPTTISELPTPAKSPAPATTPSGAASTDQPAEISIAEPEVILDQYRVTPATVKQDVRKGCLLYFVGAFVLLGIVIVILYFAIGTN